MDSLFKLLSLDPSLYSCLPSEIQGDRDVILFMINNTAYITNYSALYKGDLVDDIELSVALIKNNYLLFAQEMYLNYDIELVPKEFLVSLKGEYQIVLYGYYGLDDGVCKNAKQISDLYGINQVRVTRLLNDVHQIIVENNRSRH